MQGKKILIIGASSGIGRETAITLAEEGADLVLMSRNLEKLNEVVSLCKRGNHRVFSVDVTDEKAMIQALTESIKTDGKPYDGFVYSAGMEATIPSKLLKKDFLQRVLDVNTIPIILISNFLLKKGNYSSSGASFVFVSSVMGHLGQPAKTAYCMSKHAIVGITKSLALELAPKKIRVNCVSPGMVKTEMSLEILESISEENVQQIESMHPLGIGMPKDVANAIEFLLSDKSSWITGIDLYVDGGYSAH